MPDRDELLKRKQAERLLQKAFAADVLAKAGLLVAHRVARSMSQNDPKAQREALDKLLAFVDAHPLSPDLEKLL